MAGRGEKARGLVSAWPARPPLVSGEVGREHTSECLLAPGLSADGAELGPKVWSWRGFVPRLVCECLGALTEFVTYICAA